MSADLDVARPPLALDPDYLIEQSDWLAEQAVLAEASGLPDAASATAVAMWSSATPDRNLGELVAAAGAISRIDGSLAWLAISSMLAHAYLPAYSLQLGEAMVIAPLAGAGRLDGFTLTGQWSRLPAAHLADWLALPVVQNLPDGDSRAAVVLLAAGELPLKPAGAQAGLRGAGDHQLQLSGWAVEQSAIRAVSDVRQGVLAAVSPAVLRVALLAAASGGLAAALVAGIVNLARTKVRSGTAEPLLADPAVLSILAAAAAEVAALDAALELACRPVTENSPLSEAQTAAIVLIGQSLTDRALTHAEAAFRPIGASALFLGSPMQRFLRDLMTLSRHQRPDPDLLRAARSGYLGIPIQHRDLGFGPAMSNGETP